MYTRNNLLIVRVADGFEGVVRDIRTSVAAGDVCREFLGVHEMMIVEPSEHSIVCAASRNSELIPFKQSDVTPQLVEQLSARHRGEVVLISRRAFRELKNIVRPIDASWTKELAYLLCEEETTVVLNTTSGSVRNNNSFPSNNDVKMSRQRIVNEALQTLSSYWSLVTRDTKLGRIWIPANSILAAAPMLFAIHSGVLAAGATRGTAEAMFLFSLWAVFASGLRVGTRAWRKLDRSTGRQLRSSYFLFVGFSGIVDAAAVLFVAITLTLFLAPGDLGRFLLTWVVSLPTAVATAGIGGYLTEKLARKYWDMKFVISRVVFLLLAITPVFLVPSSGHLYTIMCLNPLSVLFSLFSNTPNPLMKVASGPYVLHCISLLTILTIGSAKTRPRPLNW